MTTTLIVLLEVTLVLGASLGLAVFDLVSMRRLRQMDGEDAANAPAEICATPEEELNRAAAACETAAASAPTAR